VWFALLDEAGFFLTFILVVLAFDRSGAAGERHDPSALNPQIRPVRS
jgi:hypothetical protein